MLAICRTSQYLLGRCCPSIRTSTINAAQYSPQWHQHFEQRNYCDHEQKDTRIGLRRRTEQPFPAISYQKKLDFETLSLKNFQQVKYGDLEFQESLDGYVHVYTDGYVDQKETEVYSGFAIYFGEKHPLNATGPVPGRQAANSAMAYAALQAIKAVPANVPKVCICVSNLTLVGFLSRGIKYLSENSYRSVRSGRLNKDLDIVMALNEAFRERSQIEYRIKFMPTDLGVDGVHYARKNAERAAEIATRAKRVEKYGEFDLMHPSLYD